MDLKDKYIVSRSPDNDFKDVSLKTNPIDMSKIKDYKFTPSPGTDPKYIPLLE